VCAFVVTNRAFELGRLDAITRYQARRGPDATTCERAFGVTFVHHLLSITGRPTPQPFTSAGAACVYNGEIYNFADYGDYPSDGPCILDAYRAAGPGCFADFDGEFAVCLVDAARRSLVCATDAFGSKPLWYAFEGREFAVASYASTVRRLGFASPRRLPGNTVLTAPLDDPARCARADLVTFDTRQHKRDYDDCVGAFLAAVRKRAVNTRGVPFVGLSSGYDSGAIAAALLALRAPFRAYSIAARENRRVLDARVAMVPGSEVIELSRAEFDRYREYVREYGEDFEYGSRYIPRYNYKDDPAAAGLALICDRARARGSLVYLSGQGGDEVLSDYGFRGRKFYSHSEFGGLFPENLGTVFPWYCFRDGTQVQYLNKEELTAGMFGIEARYPFLDRAFVQEYLWLAAGLKNRHYKAPLHEFLTARGFPFEAAEKIGFSADVGLS